MEAVTGLALLIWLGELLGTLGLFYAWILVAHRFCCVLAAGLLPGAVLSQG